MRWPNGSMSRPTVTSGFGPRRGGGGASTNHRGADFVGVGQVRAIAAGRVVVVGTPSGWSGGGRQVWIQHDGFFTRSMHLGGYAVKVGQQVAEGTILGSQDTTGTATGSHLHLEITLGNVHYSNSGQIDPVAFIQARLSEGGDWPARARYGEAWVRTIQTLLNRLGYDLTVDGKDGPATQGAVRDFQSKNGLTVDGIAGPDTKAKIDARLAQPIGRNATSRPTVDVQRLVGANPDGIWGPETTAKVIAWQKRNGLTADGIWGPESDAKGFPKTSLIPIAVDGDWGPATTKALQASLGVPVDGELGPQTISALQKAVGAPVDGKMGPVTAKHLQAALGVAQDGQIGPDTVKALQLLLNRGGKLTVVPVEPEKPPQPAPPKPAAATYPGATWWHHSPNSSNRDSAVELFIIHHTTETGAVAGVRDYMMRKNDRSVSANWLVAQDGAVSEVVPPDEYRAWTSGAIDHHAVTVETMNTSGAPNWGISRESMEAIAEIVAWASERYGFAIDRKHVIGHREVPGAATACPGPAMDLDWIVQRAAELATPVEPEPHPEPDVVTIPRVELEAMKAQITRWLA